MVKFSSNKTDEFYMDKALQLAEKGEGFTSPNPLVGAVIVKNNEIIGKGYHPESGDRHAEIFALEDAGKEAENATLYVNLEPCNHFGKTPPCTKEILKSGIKKVVIANLDPNPKVNCQGCDKLRNHDIEVITGVLAEKGRKLNEAFFKYMKENRPFIVQKTAQTVDGYLATSTGNSQWITGEKSRAYGHKLRHKLDAVLVGGNTLSKDDPRLSVRNYKGEKSQPMRVILTGDANISSDANIFNSPGGKVLIFSAEDAALELKNNLNNVDETEIIAVNKNSDGILDLNQVIEILYDKKILSVLVEGGGKINHSFLKAKLTDKFYFFIASKILGGDDGVAAFSGNAPDKISKTFRFKVENIEKLEKDILISAYPSY